jgi:signal transduction histidine kinase/ligand-binding sensor domain-containing protein/AraC-like DNA-binding protein/AmiR/NasT family two-component response regulator
VRSFWGKIYAFRIIWLLLLASASAGATEALRFEFEWISDRDGLSQNTVRCIMQDSKGLIWLGTIDGLNRYNGKKFIVMNSEKSHFTSLPDNRIRHMTEDRHGYIWVRTMTDIVCCYDLRLERFIDYDPANEQKNFSMFRICSDGDVWLWGKTGGCCRVRHEGNGVHASRFGEQELGSRQVFFVHEDAQCRIWIGTGSGIFRLEDGCAVKISSEVFSAVNESDGHLYFINSRHILPYSLKQQNFGEPVAFPGYRQLSLNAVTLLDGGLVLIAAKEDVLVFDSRKTEFIPSETVFNGETLRNASVYTDNKGNKWLYNCSGSIWRHLPDNRFEKISLISKDILSTIDAERYEVYHDSRDIIWITTYGNGLFALDPNSSRVIHHHKAGSSKLPTNYLLCVTEDKSGEIWVGTEFAGVSKISLNNYPFRILYPAPAKTGSRDNAVRLIYEDTRGRFWTGTRNGYLHICDQAFNRIKSHKIENSLPFCITEDLSGNIWLGTRGNGVLVFPPSGEAPNHHYHLHDIDRQNVSSDNVFDILRDTKNRIWVASFGGGLHYADLNGQPVTFRHINARTVNQDMVRVIVQDHTGMMWTGTNEGVNVFDPDELICDPERYINFHFDVKDDRSISNNEVKVIFEDSNGRLWFGTTGGGLNLLVREKPLEKSWFRRYTAENGLSNEVIQTILEDSEGCIWVSTEGGSGISRFNPETGRFENFNFSIGGQTALFNENASWKNKAGELMFGSYSGIYVFNPSQIRYNSPAWPVIVTGLKINGVNMHPGQKGSPLTESIVQTRSIKLKHNQNSFDIEFAMLNFRSPDFNRYAYYLDGYEPGWNAPGRHNVAVYRNVPTGMYTFRVKGCNSLGMWTDSETGLQLTIVPPLWKSGWAYAAYFALFLVAAWFAARIVKKINQLNTDVEVERQLAEYKLRFFTNISHEFRTPLTIIRGLTENLEAMEDVPSAVAEKVRRMAKSSSRLLHLIDQLLEFRRLQNNKMELKVERTEAVSLFYDIHQTFTEMAEKKRIDFRFKSDLPERVMLLDKSKCGKIAYNLLSNAIRHTPESGVITMHMAFSETDDRLRLSVSDSGAGVPKEKRGALFVRFAQFDSTAGGTGIGLHLAAELATVHKGKIEYADSESGGACFSVLLPLADENYDRTEIVETLQLPAPKSVDAVTEKAGKDAMPDIQLNCPLHNYRILVIEDDGEVREFLFDQLKDFFSVSTAENGTEGLEKAVNEQPALIVCDVMMPGRVDGFELTRRLKNDFLTSHIPIILLTAHSSEVHRLEGIQAGADSYITKPFSVRYLMARIVKLIEQCEKLRNKFSQEQGIGLITISTTEKDKIFIEKMHALIEKNLNNPDFSTDSFAQAVNMGRTMFYKKVKGITGYSPNEYVRVIRLKKAAELLRTTELHVSEIAYQVGFNDPLYFSRCFKEQFSVSPAHFKKEGFKLNMGSSSAMETVPNNPDGTASISP